MPAYNVSLNLRCGAERLWPSFTLRGRCFCIQYLRFRLWVGKPEQTTCTKQSLYIRIGGYEFIRHWPPLHQEVRQ